MNTVRWLDLRLGFAFRILVGVGLLAGASNFARAADLQTELLNWPQFRGAHASAWSEIQGAPLTWNDTNNVLWKAALPGPGSSSPIVYNQRIYLTCFTGYGTSSREPGDLANLKRHLLCLDLVDGRIIWDTDRPAEQPEQGKIRENHGYASSTPTIDDERIYTFYGRSGVYAFSHDGKEIWRTKVGDKLNDWGSATSPILHGDLVLINASVENESLIALDRKTGKEKWRATGVKESWHPPALVQTADGRTEIVIAMLRKLVAFDPATGEQLWRADTGINWYMCPTPVTADGIVYSIGGRNPNGGLAVRAGGRGDVTSSHVVWKLNKGSNVPSPILWDGSLFFAHENLGVVYCVDNQTGKLLYEERLEPSPGQIYASPVGADHRIYYLGRGGRTVVVAASGKFEVLAVNTLENNRGVFNASPAFAGNRLLIRSNRALYCLGTANAKR